MCEQLAAAHAGHAREALDPRELGRRGSRERGEDRRVPPPAGPRSSRSIRRSTDARCSTMSLTAKVVPYKKSFGPYAPEVYRAPFSYPFRGTGGLAETIAWIEASVDASQIACVVVEPIAGEGGFVVPEAGLVRRHRAVVPGQRRRLRRRRGADRFRPHRRVVRERARERRARPRRDREGSRRRHAHRGRDRPGRDHGRGPPGRARQHVRRQSGVVRGRARGDRRDRERGPRRARAEDRRPHARAPHRVTERDDRHRRRAGPRRDGRDRARPRRRHP